MFFSDSALHFLLTHSSAPCHVGERMQVSLYKYGHQYHLGVSYEAGTSSQFCIHEFSLV